MRSQALIVVLVLGLAFGFIARESPANGRLATIASKPQGPPLSAVGRVEGLKETDAIPAPTPTPTPPATYAARDGFSNSLGMKFVPVKGTNVLVCIHETRWQDYAAFAKDNAGREIVNDWRDQTIDGVEIMERAPEHPVVNVSWEDAQAFCRWLGRKEARIYRLPTDREWSAAAGIGGQEKRTRETTPEMLADRVQDVWPWGTEWPPPQDAGNYADLSLPERTGRKGAQTLENYRDGYPTTAPVMSFRPNQLGIYDLGGNVWEWCQDWWNGAETERTTRGASFYDLGRPYLHSSRRGHHPADTRLGNHGFRCVMVVPGGR
jgi:formylglycine-generating enzyme required for sulfatase activity